MSKEHDQRVRGVVLILDDQPADLANMEFAARFGGFNVVTASTKMDALVKLSEMEVDLAVLSVDIPATGGITLIKHLREEGCVPIVAMSERLDRNLIVQCFSAGADDVLAKPFFVDEFNSRIQAILRRCTTLVDTDSTPGSASSETDDEPPQRQLRGLFRDQSLQVREFGFLKMFPFKRCAYVGGNMIRLTQGEFIVLEVLAANQGTIATKRELETALYGPTGETKTKVLEVLISRLKKKLSEALGSDEALIVNHRGVGWALTIGEPTS
jgi:DNA-binding response OmpR family regulator